MQTNSLSMSTNLPTCIELSLAICIEIPIWNPIYIYFSLGGHRVSVLDIFEKAGFGVIINSNV